MLDVLLVTGVFDVEVAAVRQYIAGVDAPGVVVLFAVVPPVEAWLELFELHSLGFGIVFASSVQRLLAVPVPFGWARAVEKEQVGGYAGIGCEDAVG